MPDTQTAADPVLQAAIVAVVKKNDWVSFAELPRRLSAEHQIDPKSLEGDAVIELGNTCCIVWSSMSKSYVATLLQAMKDQQVFLHPAEYMSYLVDGNVLRLPLAKKIPPGGYKTLHWAPCYLRPVPLKPMTKQGKRKKSAKQSNGEPG